MDQGPCYRVVTLPLETSKWNHWELGPLRHPFGPLESFCLYGPRGRCTWLTYRNPFQSPEGAKFPKRCKIWNLFQSPEGAKFVISNYTSDKLLVTKYNISRPQPSMSIVSFTTVLNTTYSVHDKMNSTSILTPPQEIIKIEWKGTFSNPRETFTIEETRILIRVSMSVPGKELGNMLFNPRIF